MTFSLRRPLPRTYTITQLCREFGATPRALRFYEEQGLLSPGRRDTQRIYSNRDRARLALTIRGRRVGLKLAEIREILDAYDQAGEEAQNVRALKAFEARIRELEVQREEVERSISELRAAAARLSSNKGPELATSA
jgi:DNA-binding transcriptional MerR regulator